MMKSATRNNNSPMALSVLILSLLASVVQSLDATYQPRPYMINVDPKFIENTRLKASQFRATPNIDIPEWFDGPPGANVSQIAKYWANDFNYQRFQDEINRNFSNYIMTVPPPGGRYNRSLDIHFFHQVSKRRDAIPILLVHGWPSTNLEWAKVIPDLVNPPKSSLPAFHVVAPDLPGFGFSAAPTTSGLGAVEHATALNSLMQQLGYDRYVLYSTDLGYIIARQMVSKYEARITNHVSDFYLVSPNATDNMRYADNQTTPEETAYISSINSFFTLHSGYSDIHKTLPLSLAYALYDSPVGFLAWMWQLVFTADDLPQDPESLIRQAMGLYIPGPYNNIRAYKELFPDFTTEVSSNVPTSILQFGGFAGYASLYNINLVPRSWVERTANVTYFKRYNHISAHFPAESHPKLWLQNIWEIFRTKNP